MSQSTEPTVTLTRKEWNMLCNVLNSLTWGKDAGQTMGQLQESVRLRLDGPLQPKPGTMMAGKKSQFGPLPMIDHPAGWPYTDPNIPCDC